MNTIAVIVRNTWRLAWREPLTRVELGMLALLALLAAIAAVGSPTAGDGAIQMYAVCYSVVPFSLVLLIGQMGRDPQEEAAWWSRPISRDQVLWGRFIGFILVGSALVGLIAVWGWVLMSLIAHLPWISGAVWTLVFALLTLPSLSTVAGGALWLRAALPGARYYPLAISLSLAIAFVEYKLYLIVAALPHVTIFNPFPGFLQLGLALPPTLLVHPGISGWLWLNRVVWASFGMVLLIAAIRRRNRQYPLRHPRFARTLLAATAVITAASGGALWVNARTIAPPSSPKLSLRTNFACVKSRLILTIDAQSGVFAGHAFCQPNHGGTLTFFANAGLKIQGTAPGQASLAVAAGTAEREWVINVAHDSASLKWLVTGHLLPYPSVLSYPPFAVNQVYSGMYAGGSTVYIAEALADLPSFLSPHTPVRLVLTHLNPQNATATNGDWDATARSWNATLGNLVVTAGPISAHRRGPVTVWLARGSHYQVGAFLPYVGAIRNLSAWLAIPRAIAFVPSPVTSTTEWRSPDIVYSVVHPYSTPRDPVSGSQAPPTSYTATLTLAHLFWAGRPNLAGHADPALLTALLIFSHSNRANLELLRQQLLSGTVTDIGFLPGPIRRDTLRTWQSLTPLSRRAQRVWLRQASREGGEASACIRPAGSHAGVENIAPGQLQPDSPSAPASCRNARRTRTDAKLAAPFH